MPFPWKELNRILSFLIDGLHFLFTYLLQLILQICAMPRWMLLIRIETLPLVDFNSPWMFSNAGHLNRTDGHRVKLFEESVTFIAQLQNEVRHHGIHSWIIETYLDFFFVLFCFFLYELQDGSTGLIPPMDRPWIIGNWRIPNKHFPVIIGVSSGILILLLTITILIAWRCCRYQKLREKNFGQLTFI